MYTVHLRATRKKNLVILETSQRAGLDWMMKSHWELKTPTFKQCTSGSLSASAKRRPKKRFLSSKGKKRIAVCRLGTRQEPLLLLAHPCHARVRRVEKCPEEHTRLRIHQRICWVDPTRLVRVPNSWHARLAEEILRWGVPKYRPDLLRSCPICPRLPLGHPALHARTRQCAHQVSGGKRVSGPSHTAIHPHLPIRCRRRRLPRPEALLQAPVVPCTLSCRAWTLYQCSQRAPHRRLPTVCLC